MYDIIEDFDMIVTQYPKDFVTHTLIEDYNTIPAQLFYKNISSLKGTFGEVLSYRSRYLNGDKMSDEEKKVAREVLTKEQKDFIEWKRNNNINNHFNKMEKELINSILS